MFFFPLAIALLMMAFGVAALRLNPRRPTNQVLAAVCFISAFMFIFQLIARHEGARYAIDQVSNPMPWVRLRFACIGLLCPLMVWMSYYVVSGRYTTRANLVLKLAPWAVISLVLVGISFTEAFKGSASRPGMNLDGPLYTVYFAIMFICQAIVCVATIVVAKRLRGIRRLEFHFITISFGYLSLVVVLTAFIQNFFRDVPWLLAILQALALLVFPLFGLTAWSVTSRRIYHSSQVLLPLVERIGLLTAIGLLTVLVLRWLPASEEGPAVGATIVASACVAFLFLDEKLRGLLNIKSEQRINAVAAQLHHVASMEADPDRLIERCEAVLGHLVVGSPVQILKLQLDHYERGDLAFATSELSQSPLINEGSVSVVALARLHRQGNADDLRGRLEREHIHLLVSPRWSEHEPGIIVAFGERETGVPFTYPEIKILRALAEIVEGIYTRSRFALQARQAEQLATIGLIGAGLAHELRNPIVAIDTFAQVLPKRLNDAKFLQEFAEVIPGEAKRIQVLAGQLLDLSRPRKYELAPVDLHTILSETLVLLNSKAGDENVALTFEPTASHHNLVADASALRQIFVNLILNGIQSIAGTGQRGRIVVRTADTDGHVVIEVEDNGPGIPETIRRRLFRPFASAEKKAGLGLGLAICAEIAKVHHGRITADNAPTGGALFRVSLPISSDAIALENIPTVESHDRAAKPPHPNRRDRHSHPTAA